MTALKPKQTHPPLAHARGGGRCSVCASVYMFLYKSSQQIGFDKGVYRRIRRQTHQTLHPAHRRRPWASGYVRSAIGWLVPPNVSGDAQNRTDRPMKVSDGFYRSSQGGAAQPREGGAA